MNNSPEKIHFTGMGAITPAGITFTPLFRACLENIPLTNQGLAKITLQIEESAKKKIDNSRWIKNPPLLYSRTILFCLTAIIDALDEAGWKNFTADDVIIIGTTTGQISEWEPAMLEFRKTQKTETSKKMSKQILGSISHELQNIFDFPGRILVIASACSASTQAVALAGQYLTSNRAKRCIVGGVEELSLLTREGFNCLKLLVPSPCKPFDKNRKGINLSEGAAFFCLEKKYSDHSQGILLGGQTMLDSYHMTSPDPQGRALQKAILLTLKNAGVSAEQVSLVHAHGTASDFNDRAEIIAMNNIFGNKTPIISTKGVHGHALAASGAIEIGPSLLMLREQMVLGTTGLDDPIEEGANLNLPKKSYAASLNYILKTTLGFGGINSVILLGRNKNA